MVAALYYETLRILHNISLNVPLYITVLRKLFCGRPYHRNCLTAYPLYGKRSIISQSLLAHNRYRFQKVELGVVSTTVQEGFPQGGCIPMLSFIAEGKKISLDTLWHQDPRSVELITKKYLVV